MLAARGTQKVLAAHGIEAAAVNKVAEGRPHVVDMIKNSEIAFIVNTVEFAHRAGGLRSIRVTALSQRVTYCTIAGARAACNGMRRSSCGRTICRSCTRNCAKIRDSQDTHHHPRHRAHARGLQRLKGIERPRSGDR